MANMFVAENHGEGGRYLLELNDLVVGVFQGSKGLKAEREISYVDEGGRAFAVARLGPYAKGHFVLESGQCEGKRLLDWFFDSRDRDAYASCRRTGYVLFIDKAMDVKARWRFKNARITEWAGPSDAQSEGEAFWVEKIGISHEGLEPADV